jgi:hypothetical protein
MTTVIIDEKSKKRRIVLDILKDFIEENAVKCDDYKDYLEKVV